MPSGQERAACCQPARLQPLAGSEHQAKRVRDRNPTIMCGMIKPPVHVMRNPIRSQATVQDGAEGGEPKLPCGIAVPRCRRVPLHHTNYHITDRQGAVSCGLHLRGYGGAGLCFSRRGHVSDVHRSGVVREFLGRFWGALRVSVSGTNSCVRVPARTSRGRFKGNGGRTPERGGGLPQRGGRWRPVWGSSRRTIRGAASSGSSCRCKYRAR